MEAMKSVLEIHKRAFNHVFKREGKSGSKDFCLNSRENLIKTRFQCLSILGSLMYIYIV